MIGALVDIPAPGAEGVLFAHGTRFGGHALYVKDNRLHYVNNFVGAEEQMIVATEDVADGREPDPVGVVREGGQGADLRDRDADALPRRPEGRRGPRSRRSSARSRSPGAALFVGRHAGEPVTDDYPGTPPYAFTGGTIHQVAVDVSGEPYVDLERHAADAAQVAVTRRAPWRPGTTRPRAPRSSSSSSA